MATEQLLSVSKNRTTVRKSELQLRLLKLALQGASAIAPSVAERAAVELFARPQRRARRSPEGSARRIEVRSGAHRLATWLWGEGPMVLLVHGWEGSAAQLQPFVAPLVAEGLTVVAFDQPAHGASSGRRVNVREMARAVRDVAEEITPFMGAQKAALHGVVAHSLGGAATALAIHEGLAVDRVALLAPAAEPSYFARRVGAMLGLPEPRIEGMLRRLADELGSPLDAFDVRALAPSFAQRALVMHDPEDKDVPVAHGAGIAAGWRGARFEPLSGLGHTRLLRDKGVIARVVDLMAA